MPSTCIEFHVIALGLPFKNSTSRNNFFSIEGSIKGNIGDDSGKKEAAQEKPCLKAFCFLERMGVACDGASNMISKKEKGLDGCRARLLFTHALNLVLKDCIESFGGDSRSLSRSHC